MSERLPVLNDLQVASPCPASWADMAGDDRVRFCGQCEKNVYDLTVLTPDEIVDVITATEGKFCGRLYQRTDGRVLTVDCPVGLARVLRNAKRQGLRATAWAVGLAASAVALLLHGDPASPQVVGPDTTTTKIIEAIESVTPAPPPPPEVEPELLMGDIAVEPMPLGEIEVMPPPR